MVVAKRSPARPQGQPPFFMRRGVLGFFAALAAFGIFTTVVLVAYEEDMKSGEVIVPIVRAEKAPIKMRPETPGGMAVPFQDKLVYDQLSKAGQGAEKTRLLPPPETPVALPKAPTASSESIKVVPKSTPVIPKGSAKTTDNANQADGDGPPKTEVLRRLEMETPSVKGVPVVGKTLRVQIASLRSEQAARDQWARLQKVHDDLLGALAPHVQRADLGARGVFFRLQAGPLADVAAAKMLCVKLQQRKLGCLLVRP